MPSLSCLLALVASFALLIGPTSAPTFADPPADCDPGQTPVDTGGAWVCVDVTDPGGGGGGGEEGGTDPIGGSSGAATCTDADGKEIPCSLDGLAWFSNHTCYAGPLTPTPAGADPFWPQGEGPDTGLLYECQLLGDGTPFTGSQLIFFVADGAAPVALIDPAILAQRALDQMQLATPNIRTAPQPPDMTYVGLETWLWMDPDQWETLELTVTAGATSVTVTAAPDRATWDLTTGSTTCASPGRAWVDGMSGDAQTDCSYTWDQTSDGQVSDGFPVSSTITYQADWSCSGACLTDAGTLGEVDGLPGAAAIRVGERQSVVIGGS